MARPPTAVVVANLSERVYVSSQVCDPALVTTTTLILLRAIKKFPEETFRGSHASLKNSPLTVSRPLRILRALREPDTRTAAYPRVTQEDWLP